MTEGARRARQRDSEGLCLVMLSVSDCLLALKSLGACVSVFLCVPATRTMAFARGGGWTPGGFIGVEWHQQVPQSTFWGRLAALFQLRCLTYLHQIQLKRLRCRGRGQGRGQGQPLLLQSKMGSHTCVCVCVMPLAS